MSSNAVNKDFILEVSGMVPGAIRVCMDLCERFGEDPLHLLKDAGITRGDIWILYKDLNGGDRDPEVAYQGVYNDLQEGTAADRVRGTGYSEMGS